MDFLSGIWNYGIIFVVVLTVVVFVHEFGHYWVARRNGVKIDVFSVGFGPELFGWTDKAGTRWRISAVPLGGYVKMFGDADASSSTAADIEMTPAEKAVAFPHKRVGQRAAIVFAGPAANFIFAILVMSVMFMVYGQQVGEPVIGTVQPESAAAQAGLMPGDRVLTVNGQSVERFQDLQRLVRLFGTQPLTVGLERNGAPLDVPVTPRIIDRPGMTGGIEHVPVLGVTADITKVKVVTYGPLGALGASLKETQTMVSTTLVGIGQMIVGTRGTDELGGPIRIAQGAGEAAKSGIIGLISFVVLLSLNLGLINLFPVPVLDGGHLVFFAIEAVLGRPLGERAQEYGFRVGMFLVLALMVFATRNDIVALPIWQTVKHLFF
jgi:regulator of sigma E protease